MLLSHTHKFIYTKTFKTASTIVESFFERYCMPLDEWEFSHTRNETISHEGIVGYRGSDSKGHDFYNHMTLQEIKSRISPDIFTTYYKFCVVRNPYDKLVSGFHHLESSLSYYQKHKQSFSGKLAFRKILGKLSPHEKICNTDTILRFQEWIALGGAETFFDRDRYCINNEVLVDNFIRFESLTEDIAIVCQKLGINFDPNFLPKLKSGNRPKKEVSHYYNDPTKRAVEKVFKFEIEYFNYNLI